MGNARDAAVKIRRLYVENYKGIDKLELNFPKPRMPNDPDIFALGSENGIGKTSVLECCSLLLMALRFGRTQFHFGLLHQHPLVDVPDLLVKAGAETVVISGDIDIGNERKTIKLKIDQNGEIAISGDFPPEETNKSKYQKRSDEAAGFNLIKTICGFNPNPAVGHFFLLFHSYRKIQEGKLELGMVVDRNFSKNRLPEASRSEFAMNEFKLIILRSLMQKGDLFESVEDQDADKAMDKLNELVAFYAGGTIGKLRPSSDNTVDFRITPINGESSFSFDGLSSGQKEIISTLFMIWLHTKDRPSVVLIDEPELHLNAQWHGKFVKKLASLVPGNQYILATHSEDVMDSVGIDRRILLVNDREGDQ